MRIKKGHLALAIACGGLMLGGVSFGVANNVIAHKNIAKCEVALVNETTEEKIEKLKAKIEELMNNNLVKSIVSYSTSVAGIGGFIFTLIKYKKYKSLTTEQIASVSSQVVSDQLKKVEENILNKLIERFGDVEKAMAEVTTVLTMMQDTTTKGKAALIEYLANNVKDEEVKEVIEEVKENVSEEVQKEEEIKEEVQKEYNPIE